MDGFEKADSPIGSGETYSAKDSELIKQLVQSRMQQEKGKMEYETFDGYQLPPPTQFSMLKKPAVSIKFKQLTFNMACIRLFEGVKYILPIVHERKKRLSIIPCAEEESATVEWARQNKEETWVNKQITSLEFVTNVFKMMGWNMSSRYKILGRVANSPRGLILMFDLAEAVQFTTPEEYVDKETGDVKKRQLKYFPDEYKDRIGMSYSDYAETHQMNLFECFDGYNSSVQTYEDALNNRPSLGDSDVLSVSGAAYVSEQEIGESIPIMTGESALQSLPHITQEGDERHDE